jgi:hypothetical protein
MVDDEDQRYRRTDQLTDDAAASTCGVGQIAEEPERLRYGGAGAWLCAAPDNAALALSFQRHDALRWLFMSGASPARDVAVQSAPTGYQPAARGRDRCESR